jgi:hypothetical protein
MASEKATPFIKKCSMDSLHTDNVSNHRLFELEVTLTT